MMNDMVSKGLDASDQDLGTIANYLSTYLALSKDTGASAPATPPQP